MSSGLLRACSYLVLLPDVGGWLLAVAAARLQSLPQAEALYSY
jgi:hypothetical protein